MSAVPAPTPRLQALLDGPSRWHTLVEHDTVGSTNDVAAEALKAGTAPGLVVVAARQSAGRGRRGRTWQDAPDGATSLLLSATAPAPSVPTLVPLAAGLAVRGAGRRVGARVDLKWPNDAIVGGAKCAGVLVERHGDAVVIGIGVDVDWRGADRSGERGSWTSFAEAARTQVDRYSVLADVLAGLDSWLHDVERDRATMLGIYAQSCATIGRDVVVTTPAGSEIRGRATGIEHEGALLVDTDEGTVAVTAGDVEHVR